MIRESNKINLNDGDHVKIYYDGQPLWGEVIGRPGDEEIKIKPISIISERELIIKRNDIIGIYRPN